MTRFFKKVPEFKIPKYKMDKIDEIEELNFDRSEENLAQIRANAEKKKDPKEYPGTNFDTFKQAFLESTVKYADRPFCLETFSRKAGFETKTYAEFRTDVLEFGTGLMRAYDLEDKRVIIIGENTYEWYVAYAAMLMGVGIAVPLDAKLPENEIENLITRSRAEAVVFAPKMKDLVKKAVSRTAPVKYMIEMYSEESLKDNYVGFEFVKKEGRMFTRLEDNHLIEKEIDPDAFAALFFTSGTTSESKGVMLSNRNLAANINAASRYVNLTCEDRLFSVLPLHHTYESTIGFIYPVGVGASVAINQSLKTLVNDMQATNPTAILGVPILIETLHKRIMKNIEKSGKVALIDKMIRLTNALQNFGIDVKKKVFKEIYASLGGKLRIIVSAAAPIDPKVGKWLQDIGIIFLQGYGLTETAPIAALTPDYDTRVGSCGKAVYGVEIKIDDPNENGEGDVLIKGVTLMLGYYENQEATDEVVKDGWFNSGDVGYMDEDGFVYLTGRSKNVIVTQNGKNIYPEEIEELLKNVPEIKECMVYGKEVSGEKELIITLKAIPDYEAIQEIHGAESKREKDSEGCVKGTSFTEEEIYKMIWAEVKNVNRMISNYKAVKKLEIKNDEFIKTSTMKIKRFAEIAKDKEAEAAQKEN